MRERSDEGPYDAPRYGEPRRRTPGPGPGAGDHGRELQWRPAPVRRFEDVEGPASGSDRAMREARYRREPVPPRGPLHRDGARFDGPEFRESWRERWRGSQPRPDFRHETFRRESERDADLHYFGTGAPGVGGTGFTGGRFGYGDDRSYPGPGRADVGLYREDYPGQTAEEWSRESRPARPRGQGATPIRRRYPPGPKGYQRSDERLREDISERLLQSHHIDSSDVTVEVTGGKVRLDGTVPERPMKHEIEDLVDACPGVQDIENRLKVRSTPGR